MKISSVKVNNFLGLRHLDVKLGELNFFAGTNASGKSSLENAIRLGFTGMLTRVDLKKEIGKLVHEGAKDAAIVIEGVPGANVTITASGTHKGINNPENTPWWSHCLTNQTYLSTLDPTALRKVLFEMSGGTSKAEIIKRLIQGGGDPALVETLSPLLGNFEAAEKEAGVRATTARGEWKGITGETYGEVKAATWKAPKPEVPAKPTSDEQALTDEVERLRNSVANAKAAAAQRAQAESSLAEAMSGASQIEGRQKAVKTAQEDVEATERAVAALEKKAAGKAMPDPLAIEPCPECGSVLCVMPPFGEVQHPTLIGSTDYDERNKAKPDPKAQIALKAAKEELAGYGKVLHAAQRALAEANDDARDVGKLAKTLANMAPLAETSPDALAAAINAREACMTEWKVYTDAERAAREASNKGQRALAAHNTAVNWTVIKELLSPNGVPAQFLDGVLTKMNDRLRVSAERTKWLQTQIHADMSITCGGRMRVLCSESEKWRCDSMMTEAVSYLTAEGFLMLDRVDVLHHEHRRTLLTWCDELAKDGCQCILFQTTKEQVKAEQLGGWVVVNLIKGEAA